MDYFLDTNIKIGYVFCTDPWNKESVQLFDMHDTFHYSHCVEKEFNRKFNHLLKEQNNFLFSLKNDLQIGNQNQSLSLQDLKNKAIIIPLRREFAENKKIQIVEVIWEFSKSKHQYDYSNNPVCNVKNLITYIDKFIRSFKGKLIYRKNDFEREVIFHSKRDDDYMDLNEKLIYDADIHYPDNCIILDAHDVSLNECINLEFISADEKMIAKVNNIINSLKIDKFHYLKEFC